MKVAIIGLGVVGREVLKEMHNKIEGIEVTGFDIDDEKINELSKDYDVRKNLNEAFDVYIIDTYTSDQVLNVVNKIDYSKRPLVSIESTVFPETHKELIKKVIHDNNSNLIFFPHRLNPGDREHHVFNIKRVMGGATKKCLERGYNFYKQFMAKENIITTSIVYAELSKVLENAYRFVEIAIAEELKMLCDKYNLDFNELRNAANSKWNIDIKEARDGICGACLPKDVKLFNDFFKDNIFFNAAVDIDRKYKERVKRDS